MRIWDWQRVVAGIVAALACTTGSSAQEILHTSGPLPSYEVTNVRKAGSDAVNNTSTIRRYIQLAYNIPPASVTRVIGGPAWIATDRYTIEGKIPDALRDKMKAMTSTEYSNQTRLLQRSLLAERFHLKVHFETREMQVFELVFAKGGSKLKDVGAPERGNAGLPPIPPGDRPLSPASIGPGTTMARIKGSSVEMLGRAVPMRALTNALLQQFELEGRPIVDKTGLAGNYDFSLQWTAAVPPAVNGGAPQAGDTSGPSLFTALQEELGLRLVPVKDPVEVLVIDSIERPSQN